MFTSPCAAIGPAPACCIETSRALTTPTRARSSRTSPAASSDFTIPCSLASSSIGSTGTTSSAHRRYPPAVAQTRTFLLMGSGEFEPWSSEIETAALDGRHGPVAVLPTASSTEGDAVFDRWGTMGLDHYAGMGIEAHVVPVKSREDADDERYAKALDDASMIFFSGGKPPHLASTILGTKLWNAMLVALDRGAVY